MSFEQGLVQRLTRLFPLPEVGFLMSMVLGKRSYVPSYYQQLFEVTGMQHVLVASGSNVALVALVGTLFLRPITALHCTRQQYQLARLLLVGSMVVIYVAFVDWEPSLLRAMGMFFYAQVCQWRGKVYQPVWGLIVTTLVWSAFRPAVVQGLSYQLSALASLGIIWWVPLFSQVRFLSRLDTWESHTTWRVSEGSGLRRIARCVLDVGIESWWISLAVQIMVWPLLWWHFGEVAWGGLIANTVLLWQVEIVNLVGLMGMVGAGLQSVPLVSSIVRYYSVALHTTLQFFIWSLGKFAWVGELKITSKPGAGVIVGWWFCLVGVYAGLIFLKRTRRQWRLVHG